MLSRVSIHVAIRILVSISEIYSVTRGGIQDSKYSMLLSMKLKNDILFSVEST